MKILGKTICAVGILLLVAGCAKKVPEDAVVQVGDRYITQKEFEYRANFTPHPNFPTFNQNLEQVLLTNLVMEKIFAQEFGKSSELSRNELFRAFIKGRKEQAMREQLFYKKAYDVVKLDSAEVEKTLRLSQREYDLEFYSIHNDSIGKALRARVQAHPDSALAIFNSIMPAGKRPTWTAKWKDPDHINIHEALFSGPLKQDSVIGPLQLDYDQWIFIKVVNWRDVLLFGGEDAKLRKKEVIEKLTLNKATRNWDRYLKEVMKGKEIQFNPDIFKKLADLTYDLNRTQDQQKKLEILGRFWQMEDSTLVASDLPTEAAFLQQPFFTIDGITWTVGDFRKALMSHPLVYRRQAMNRGQFYFEFRRAIAAMVRDLYLNKEAYKMRLDKDPKVVRATEMWEDAVVANFERNRIIAEIAKAFPDTTDPARQFKLNKAFDEYLDGLQKKYQKKIVVNREVFDKIEIPKVQVFVVQQNVPYPIVVPQWPMFYTKNIIENLPYKEK
ncbi:MAG: hypothetical protein ONB12_03385 [candidate division KSB1 bacterium]|nr:hypothetical protein [candidate division KSB1 bacterium]